MEVERIGQKAIQPAIGQEQVQQSATVQQAARLLREAAARTDVKAGPTDSVEISQESRDLARAQEAVEMAPDVRADRVAQIKQSLADGTYSVPPELLAAKLLGDSQGGA